jgi:hypothetical protein
MTSPKNGEAALPALPETAPEVPSEPIAPTSQVGPTVSAPTVSAPTIRRPVRYQSSRSTSTLLVIGALVAAAGIGFAIGHVTGSGQTSSSSQGGANGPASGFGANASGLPDQGANGLAAGSFTISGTVVSVSADSITLQLADGSTTTIGLDSSTTYHGQSAATSADVVAGETVKVQTAGGVLSGAPGGPNAAASSSPGTTGRTATDVTIAAE